MPETNPDIQSPLLDSEGATFTWRGPRPPRLLSDLNNWDPSAALPFTSLAAGLWACRVPLPADAYLEYVYLLNGERQLDPLNPRRVFNGIDADNNYFYMPAAGPTPLAKRALGVPRGRVTRHVIEDSHLVEGGRRVVHLYAPAVSEPCPLLVVFDGRDYLRRAALAKLVDNLIAQKRIRPIALALLDNSRRARGVEYSGCDATLGFVLREVLPLACQHLNLLSLQEHPGAYGVLGASMGGLAAFYAALRAPQVFGRLLGQSTACFSESIVLELLRLYLPRPLDIWMDVGRFEGLLAPNRELYARLQEKGYRVTWREYPGGHNYTSWRDDLWRGLEALFPYA